MVSINSVLPIMVLTICCIIGETESRSLTFSTSNESDTQISKLDLQQRLMQAGRTLLRQRRAVVPSNVVRCKKGKKEKQVSKLEEPCYNGKCITVTVIEKKKTINCDSVSA